MSKEMAAIKATNEEKLSDRDEKLRQMKAKYDELMTKHRQIVQENDTLHNKIDSLPGSAKLEM